MDSRLRGNDKQQISVSISVNPVYMECELKKQTQFQNGQISARYYMKGDYGNNPAGRAQKNKANYTLTNRLKELEKDIKSLGAPAH